MWKFIHNASEKWQQVFSIYLDTNPETAIELKKVSSIEFF